MGKLRLYFYTYVYIYFSRDSRNLLDDPTHASVVTCVTSLYISLNHYINSDVLHLDLQTYREYSTVCLWLGAVVSIFICNVALFSASRHIQIYLYYRLMYICHPMLRYILFTMPDGELSQYVITWRFSVDLVPCGWRCGCGWCHCSGGGSSGSSRAVITIIAAVEATTFLMEQVV